jgi:periplasmic divalent cation tolerance protein
MADDATNVPLDTLADTTETVIVLTTWPADRDPEELAARLVQDRLAACVNALPEMRSFYTWRGALCDEPERQLVVKTTRAALPDLLGRLRELHPYEVPEFLVLPVTSGSASYLSWVAESVGR